MNMQDAFRRHMDGMMADAFGLTTSQIAPERPPLTIDSLMAQMRELTATIDRAAAPLRVVIDHNALEATAERLFPASRHRSARIRKKLVKRFGGEFRMQPVIWKIGNVIYAHPVFEKQFRASFPARQKGERV